MQQTIVTRIATVDDAPALARLNLAFNGVDLLPDVLSSRLADPQRVEQPLVAEIDGRVIGFAALRVTPSLFYESPHGELTELYVDVAFRRRGVGRALLLLAEQIAKTSGVTQLWVLTDSANRAARTLYNALGYDDGDLALSKELLQSDL